MARHAHAEGGKNGGRHSLGGAQRDGIVSLVGKLGQCQKGRSHTPGQGMGYDWWWQRLGGSSGTVLMWGENRA